MPLKIRTLTQRDLAEIDPSLASTLGDHPVLGVTFEPKDSVRLCCGRTHCTGTCGLPALVMTVRGVEMKAHCCYVACGHVMQAPPRQWTGTRIEVPTEHQDYLLKAMYW